MLKALVGIMGVLIVLGTAVVAGTIVHRVYANALRPSMAAAPPPAPAAGPVVLPAGSHVSGIAAAGGAVAVWVSGPSGDQVWLMDPQSGVRRVALVAPAGK